MIFHTNTSVPPKKNCVSNASPLDARKKNEERTRIPSFRECTSQHDFANADSKSTHQKTLKVRIKVGSDTALARPNAAIYSVMGLEYSPSSSPDSPGTGGGSHLGHQSGPHESPTTICLVNIINSNYCLFLLLNILLNREILPSCDLILRYFYCDTDYDTFPCSR